MHETGILPCSTDSLGRSYVWTQPSRTGLRPLHGLVLEIEVGDGRGGRRWGRGLGRGKRRTGLTGRYLKLYLSSLLRCERLYRDRSHEGVLEDCLLRFSDWRVRKVGFTSQNSHSRDPPLTNPAQFQFLDWIRDLDRCISHICGSGSALTRKRTLPDTRSPSSVGTRPRPRQWSIRTWEPMFKKSRFKGLYGLPRLCGMRVPRGRSWGRKSGL